LVQNEKKLQRLACLADKELAQVRRISPRRGRACPCKNASERS